MSRFSVKVFLPHSAEKFVGERFSVSLYSGIGKIYDWEGYSRFSVQFFIASKY